MGVYLVFGKFEKRFSRGMFRVFRSFQAHTKAPSGRLKLKVFLTRKSLQNNINCLFINVPLRACLRRKRSIYDSNNLIFFIKLLCMIFFIVHTHKFID